MITHLFFSVIPNEQTSGIEGKTAISKDIMIRVTPKFHIFVGGVHPISVALQ